MAIAKRNKTSPTKGKKYIPTKETKFNATFYKSMHLSNEEILINLKKCQMNFKVQYYKMLKENQKYSISLKQMVKTIIGMRHDITQCQMCVSQFIPPANTSSGRKVLKPKRFHP